MYSLSLTWLAMPQFPYNGWRLVGAKDKATIASARLNACVTHHLKAGVTRCTVWRELAAPARCGGARMQGSRGG